MAIVHSNLLTELLVMALVKTESGKTALQSRDLGLTPRMRQIMVLANGTHSRESIQDLMERDIGAELHWLVQSGYLDETVDTRYAVDRIRKPLETQQQTTRRSLAGTKMYIIDMLQLLRDVDAASMAVSIHTSKDEVEFIQNIVTAARLIALKSGSSYGQRVVNKLREIVPAVHLAALQELTFDLETDISLLQA
jgi:hypothetical protein